MKVSSPILDHQERDKDQEEISGQVEEVEDEYVLLDLEDVFHGAGLPANCPYTLSKLDTMNPILTLGDGGLKLIGEYEETVGQCLVFTEQDEEVSLEGQVHPHDGSTKANQDTKRRINSLCRVEKKLKFRIMNIPDKETEIVQGGK
ncbi:unnamed protein product [Calypogeia fissa]